MSKRSHVRFQFSRHLSTKGTGSDAKMPPRSPEIASLSSQVSLAGLGLSELVGNSFLASRGKRPQSVSNLQFAGSLLASPLLLVLSPLALLCQIWLRSSKSASVRSCMPSSLTSMPPPSKEERKYDLVLVGATGFTGRLALEYLLCNYPDLNMAVSGRNEKKLKSAVAEVGKILGRDSTPSVDCLIADANSYEQLSAVARSARVVVSTAGPFAKIGSKLVEVCCHSGTHYADITGETAWVRNNIKLYNSFAEKSGAVVMSLCGMDSIPWEVSSKVLEGKLSEKGEKLRKLVFKDEMSTSPSGGTTATIIEAVESPEVNVKSNLGFDPWYGSKKSGKVKKNRRRAAQSC